MAMKDFDFKQFMIEKGERVALGAAAALMLFLVVMGLIVNGLGSGSASANAEDVNRLRTAGERALANSRPPEELVQIDPELLRAGKIDTLDPRTYLADRPFFLALQPEDTKWRKPKVLEPDEFQADIVRGLVRSYMFAGTLKSPRLVYLRPKDKKQNQQGQGARGGMMGRGRMMMMGMGRGMMMPGGPGGGGVGSPDGGGGGSTDGGGGPGGDFMQPGGAAADKQELTFVEVPIERVAKDDKIEGWPAERTIPFRMAVIQAAFPYKEQMDECRRALRYSSVEAMEREALVEFAGVNIQRRLVGAGGKTGEWEIIPVVDLLRPVLVFGAEPEDHKLLEYGLVWPKDRLVVPRPMLARNQQYPPSRMAGIKDTMEVFDQIAKDQLPPPMERKSKFDGDFDIFEATPNEGSSRMGAAGTGMGPGGMDGGPGMGMGMGGPGPGAGGGMRGMEMQREMMRRMQQMRGAGGGVGGPGAGGGTGMGPGGPGYGGSGPGLGMGGMAMGSGGQQGQMTSNQERTLPDKVLVRFIDPTVKPGNTYEYQIQVRMANPLFERPDKAISKNFTTAKEIASEWRLLPNKVYVPIETEFYAFEDEKRAKTLANNPDRVWMQIHRWFDWIQLAANNKDAAIPVGDWSIAEQVPVNRGEYIGRIEELEVPTWFPKLEAFAFAHQPTPKKGPKLRGKGIHVNFATDAILVDFQGGRQDFKFKRDGRDLVSIKDESPQEVLIMLADGRLILRNSRDDGEDAERKERLETWKNWIKKVREDKDNAKQPGGPGAPGGESGKGGSVGQ